MGLITIRDQKRRYKDAVEKNQAPAVSPFALLWHFVA
jgi:hypothetical protein